MKYTFKVLTLIIIDNLHQTHNWPMNLAEIGQQPQPNQACFGQLGAPSGLVGLARPNLGAWEA